MNTLFNGYTFPNGWKSSRQIEHERIMAEREAERQAAEYRRACDVAAWHYENHGNVTEAESDAQIAENGDRS